MKSDKVNEMFQKHLNPEEPLLYPDFLNDLCKFLVQNNDRLQKLRLCFNHYFR